MATKFRVVKYMGWNEPFVLAHMSLCRRVSSEASKRIVPCSSSNVKTGQRRNFLTSCSCAGVSQDNAPHPSLIGPSVRNLLELYHLENVSIEPSGQKGQLLKGDILKYIKENEKVPKMFTPETTTVELPSSDIPTTPIPSDIGYTDMQSISIGETIGRQVIQSKIGTPHIYTTIECNMDNVLAMQKQLEKYNIGVTVNDFIIKAASLSLSRVPEVNSYWNEDSDSPVLFNTVNVAVAISSPQGSIVPVVNAANELDIQSLSSTLKELSKRANEGQLKAHEVQGGTFTVSNLGTFGVKHFTAVIYPRQTGVLGIGQPQVNVSDDGQRTTIMTVTLSCDGRIVDETTASMWLEEFKKLIENPLQMGL